MRRLGAAIVSVCLCSIAGCGNDATSVAAPSVVDLWLGPEVIATPTEIVALSLVASDPLMKEVTSELPEGHREVVDAALVEFELGLADAPGPSYLKLQQALVGLDEDSTLASDPDADLANEAVGLYRDYAAQALFGIERNKLGDLGATGGN